MTANFTHIHFRHRLFQFGIVFFFLLALGIYGKQYRESSFTIRMDEDVDLEGVTSAELFEFREKYPSLFLPPQDVEKAREIVRQCEELWNELQEFKIEPDFSSSHLLEGTRYHDWLKRAKTLRDSLPAKEEIGSDVHALPNALIAAALDLAGRCELPWKCSAEEWFAEYHLPVARKAAQFNP